MFWKWALVDPIVQYCSQGNSFEQCLGYTKPPPPIILLRDSRGFGYTFCGIPLEHLIRGMGKVKNKTSKTEFKKGRQKGFYFQKLLANKISKFPVFVIISLSLCFISNIITVKISCKWDCDFIFWKKEPNDNNNND